jgi:hypothetical protein
LSPPLALSGGDCAVAQPLTANATTSTAAVNLLIVFSPGSYIYCDRECNAKTGPEGPVCFALLALD